MKVALFTSRTEPTHHAIAQVVGAMTGIRYTLIARQFTDNGLFELPNIERRITYYPERICVQDVLHVDAVHAIYDGYTAMRAGQLAHEARLPFILSFHGGFDIHAKIIKPDYADATRALAHQAAAVTVVSVADVQRLREIGISCAVTVVPVPIDLGLVPRRKKYDPGTLLFVGRLVGKKGLDVALGAMALLPSRFRLIIVGDGVLRKEAEACSSSLGLSARVEWRGELPIRDMLALLAKSEMLIVPSRRSVDGNADGTPQVILWAQAVGVPVIASRSGGIAEVLQGDSTGVLVEPEHPEELAAAVLRLSGDPHLVRAIVGRGNAVVKDKHCLTRVAEQWRRVYAIATPQSRRVPSSTCCDIFSGLDSSAKESFNKAVDQLHLDPWRIARFRQGGQGILFLISLQEGGRALLKIPSYGARSSSDAWLARHAIAKEATVLGKLNLLNCALVPRLIASDDEGHFLVREFVTGEVLHDLILANTAWPTRLDVLRLLLQTAFNLFQIFHENILRCFVIRDFKPLNLVLPYDGERLLKLIDVGSARPEAEMLQGTRLVNRLGSGKWRYWSPEQLLGDAETLDRRADYFALGVTAFFVLTGRIPYSNMQRDPGRSIEVYLQEYDLAQDVLRELKACGGLLPPVIELLCNCLHPLAEHRTGTMARLREVLDAFQ